MFKKLLLVFSLIVVPSAWQEAAAGEPAVSVSQWIPSDAALVLDVTRPESLLDPILAPKFAAAVTSLPLYAQVKSNPGFGQFFNVVALLETRLKTDWRTGARKLLGGGATLVVFPDQGVLLSLDCKDRKLLEELHEAVLTLTQADSKGQADPDRGKSVDYQGVTAWSFNGTEAHAIVGDRLLLASHRSVLRRVLDQRAGSGGASLDSLETYQAAKQAAGSQAAATLFVNLELLKQAPGIQRALTQDTNPMAALLVPTVTEALQKSRWAMLSLQTEEKTLCLRATTDRGAGGPDGVAPYAWPEQPDQGLLPNLEVPRRIAGLSFYRDLHAFYAAKDELFPDRTSGIIFFENMMGIFFTGRDLTEEVLAQLRPDVRIVVAEQAYDPKIGTPAVQYPGFAIVFRVRDSKNFAEVIEEAWQKAVGFTNFTRGQQALPGLIIDRSVYGDVKFTTAAFASGSVKDRQNLDERFNFSPSLAVVGDYLILSSAESLTRDLIDAVKQEMAASVKALAETHSLVEIDAGRLASILSANRERLILNSMRDEGKTREQAEGEIGLLTTLVKLFGLAELSLGGDEQSAWGRLQVQPELPN